jgi:hypothetical protein
MKYFFPCCLEHVCWLLLNGLWLLPSFLSEALVYIQNNASKDTFTPRPTWEKDISSFCQKIDNRSQAHLPFSLDDLPVENRAHWCCLVVKYFCLQISSPSQSRSRRLPQLFDLRFIMTAQPGVEIERIDVIQRSLANLSGPAIALLQSVLMILHTAHTNKYANMESLTREFVDVLFPGYLPEDDRTKAVRCLRYLIERAPDLFHDPIISNSNSPCDRDSAWARADFLHQNWAKQSFSAHTFRAVGSSRSVVEYRVVGHAEAPDRSQHNAVGNHLLEYLTSALNGSALEEWELRILCSILRATGCSFWSPSSAPSTSTAE